MKRHPSNRTLLTLTLAIVAIVGIGAVAGAQPTADDPLDAENTPHDPGEPTNLTLIEQVTDDTETDDLQRLVTESNATNFTEVNPFSATTFGIDRDGDDPGTQFDETLFSEAGNFSANESTIVAGLEGPRERNLGVQSGDEIVAEISNDGDGDGEMDVENEEGVGIFEINATIDDGPTASDTLLVADLRPLRSSFELPTDPDDDSRYEDVNGDGTFNIVDVQALFANRNDEDAVGNPAFDFNGDGVVNVNDVQALFVEFQGT
jgi:hypothetical protein